MAQSADWLHMDTFPPIGDALPKTRRLLNTSKNGFAVLAIYIESNHEFRTYDPIAVVYIAHWLDPNTLPPVEDALPHTTRLFHTWKKSCATNSSQNGKWQTGSVSVPTCCQSKLSLLAEEDLAYWVSVTQQKSWTKFSHKHETESWFVVVTTCIMVHTLGISIDSWAQMCLISKIFLNSPSPEKTKPLN